MDSPFWIYCIGLSAQVLFSARVLTQWYLSEKNGRIESPSIYWMLSLFGSMILFAYGWLRSDFSIIFGEFFAYYIYIWNLKAKGLMDGKPKALPIIMMLIPLAAALPLLKDAPGFAEDFLKNDEVPIRLLIFGTLGQFIFKMRFIYQWIYSVRHKESLLPPSFWIIAITGSLMIIAYGAMRHDWVLIIGQFGIIASIRNVMIGWKNKKAERLCSRR